MGRKPNKIPEPPEWLLIANHDALLTSLEIAKLLGVCRMTVTNRVSEGTFPKPDLERFESHDSTVNMRRRGSTSRRLYWKVSTVRKFLKQQVQNQIDELKQQQQLQERAQ
jgi:IS30 family transposase